jgi:hypothetical protein
LATPPTPRGLFVRQSAARSPHGLPYPWSLSLYAQQCGRVVPEWHASDGQVARERANQRGPRRFIWQSGPGRRAERTAAPAARGRLIPRCTCTYHVPALCPLHCVPRERGSSERSTRGAAAQAPDAFTGEPAEASGLEALRWVHSLRFGAGWWGGGWWGAVRCSWGGGSALRLAAHVLHREAVKAWRVRPVVRAAPSGRVAGRRRRREARLRLCEVRQQGRTPNFSHSPPPPSSSRVPTPAQAHPHEHNQRAAALRAALLICKIKTVPFAFSCTGSWKSRGDLAGDLSRSAQKQQCTAAVGLASNKQQRSRSRLAQ